MSWEVYSGGRSSSSFWGTGGRTAASEGSSPSWMRVFLAPSTFSGPQGRAPLFPPAARTR